MISPILGRNSGVGEGEKVGIGVWVAVGRNQMTVGVVVWVAGGVSDGGNGTGVVGTQAERPYIKRKV
jgi:hypothetical protein